MQEIVFNKIAEGSRLFMIINKAKKAVAIAADCRRQ